MFYSNKEEICIYSPQMIYHHLQTLKQNLEKLIIKVFSCIKGKVNAAKNPKKQNQNVVNMNGLKLFNLQNIYWRSPYFRGFTTLPRLLLSVYFLKKLYLLYFFFNVIFDLF